MKNLAFPALGFVTILMLVSSGCADKPLPIPPGTNPPEVSGNAQTSSTPSIKEKEQAYLIPDPLTSSGAIQEDTLGSSNSGNNDFAGTGFGAAKDNNSESGNGNDDFISGPLTGDGSVSGGIGKTNPQGSSRLNQRNSDNSFAEKGSSRLNQRNSDNSFAERGGNSKGMAGSEDQLASRLPFHTTEDMKDIFFNYDKHDLTEESKSILKQNATWLKDNPDVKVEIEGHCDERGTNNYNLSLGERRAQSTKEYLISMGIPQSRIYTISYGEERPFCVQSGEECWWQNRRGHFMISK